jgi:sulfur carrier protein
MNVEEKSIAPEMIDKSIRVYINGQIHAMPRQQTVATVLEILSLPAERVAVELNKSIVRKREWASTPVADGAQIEIVEFVGGG